MKACFSIATITPREALPLAGYAGRAGNFTAVDAPLEANFLAVFDSRGDPVVLGGLDTLFVGDGIADDMARRAGIPRERMILISSHTHSAPSLSPGTPRLGRFEPIYGEMVVRVAGDAIRKLVAGPPTSVSTAYAERPAPFNVNRRRLAWMLDYGTLRRHRRFRFRKGIAMAPNPRGIADPMLRCIVMRDGGRVRAIVWSYACHPAFYPFVDRVSPDFPGVVRNSLRRAFGEDCVVIYLPGFAGSAIPRISLGRCPVGRLAALLLPFNRAVPSFTPAGYRHWAEEVAGAAVACVSAASGEAPTDEIVYDTTRSPVIFGADTCPGVRLDAVRLDFGGSCGILALAGEPVCEWRPMLSPDMLDRRIATGYLAGPCLYVPTDRVVAEGGYEADGFREAFGLDGTFADGLDAAVTGTLEELFARRPRSPRSESEAARFTSHR